MLNRTFHRGFQALLVVGMLLAITSPIVQTSTLAEPAESTVYTEDFSSYTNKGYVQDTQWDVWSHSLRLRRTDGAERAYPSVATNPLDSSVMVVWQDDRNSDNDIYLQKLDTSGNKVWQSDLRVNSDTGLADQYTPAIAINSAGIAFVVWQDWRSEGYGIYAQKFDMNGNRLWANDVRVSSTGRCNDAKPTIAIEPSGGFILVWQAQVLCSSDSNIYMQRISSNGNRIWGDDARVNSDTGTATQSEPDVAVNTTGKIAIAWQDARNGNDDIFAQQFDVNGTRLWATDVLVNSDGGTSAQHDPTVAITSDGSSVIAWGGNDIFAQSLNPSGVKRWAADTQINSVSTGGQWYPTAAVSPNGDFFIAWTDHRVAQFTAYIYGQLINANGSKLWSSDVRVSDEPDYFGYPDVTVDSAGNAIIASRSSNVVAQKIDPDGTLVWGADVLVGPESGTVYQEDPVAATDGTGGAFIVWGDYRSGVEDMYIQRINSTGTKLWQTDLRVNSPGNEAFPAVAADGNGNAIIAWASLRDGTNLNIYAQKIDLNGNRLWSREVQVNAGNGFLFYPSVATDPGGNAFIAWESYPNLYLQKLDSNGSKLWTTSQLIATNIGDYSRNSSDIAADGGGNVIVTWRGTVANGYNVYAQKLNSSGVPLWGSDIQVNSVAATVENSFPTLAVDNSNNAIVIWPDIRASSNSAEIYAQKISSGGNKLWGTDVKVNAVNRQMSGSWDGADISVDSSGNAAIIWRDLRDAGGTLATQIYAQKLSPTGVRQWGNDIRISADSSIVDRAYPAISVDSNGNTFVVWNDARNGNQDIFAQRINSVGNRTWLSDLQVVTPDLFYFPSGLAQSRTIDTVSGDIRQATLTANYQANGGNIEFALSNNGGTNWVTATLGTATVFTTTGSDLRWRAILTGDPLWRNRSPIVTSLRIEYSTAVPYADDYEADDDCAHAKPIATGGAAQTHTFHQQADADWTWFNAISGTTYILQTTNVGPQAQTRLELHPTCAAPPTGSNISLGNGVTLNFTANQTGPIFVKVLNQSPTVFGANTTYQLSARVVQPTALAVIIAGHDNTFSAQDNITYAADRAYNLFRRAGLGKANIRFLDPNPNRDVDGNGFNDDIAGMSTLDNVRAAIQDWPRERGLALGVPLYIYLVDHGLIDHFKANGDALSTQVSATDLNLWLSNLEATTGADNINVIIDACYSGSFIDVTPTGLASISGHNRVIIASTTSNWNAYGPFNGEGLNFSNAFFTALENQQSLLASFEAGQAAAAALVTEQQAWLDDNGDHLFTTADGALATARALRRVTLSGQPPRITNLSMTTSDLLQAQVVDDSAWVGVQVEVFAPDYVPPQPDGSGTTRLINVPIASLSDPDADGLFTTTYPFTQTGWYRLVAHAEDTEGNLALPIATRVCVNCSTTYLPLVRK